MILPTERWLAAALLLLGWLALCAASFARERRRRRASRAAAERLLSANRDTPAVLIAHASQTGTAEALAWQTASALRKAGVPARIASLATVGAAELGRARQALFIVSTYGEGDPPDSAAPFTRRVMARAGLALDELNYAVLALGDRSYANFCGFGRLLDGWLRERGARPLFARVDVDNGSAAALDDWRVALTAVTGTALEANALVDDTDRAEAPARGQRPSPDPASVPAFAPGSASASASVPAPAYGRWRLSGRRLANPGSVGAPAWLLELVPDDDGPAPDWQAGDLFRVLVPGDRERPREYSLASLPADGCVQLLVRLARRADGSPGAASGWLSGIAQEALAVGDVFEARIQAHPGFRLGSNANRPLILIGNGTGLAGLRALLKARAAMSSSSSTSSPPPAWLLFGERQAAHDGFFDEELATWRATGVLARCDRVWSRDPPVGRYVQHRLTEAMAEIRIWVDAGAAIYVCGSLNGMAGGVDEALATGLGRDRLDDLIVAGRYRRDVY